MRKNKEERTENLRLYKGKKKAKYDTPQLPPQTSRNVPSIFQSKLSDATNQNALSSHVTGSKNDPWASVKVYVLWMSRYSKRQEGGTEERRQRVRGDCVIISPEHLINQRTEIVKETKWRGRDGEREFW